MAELAVEAGQLSVAGRDLTRLPPAVAERFGASVTSLDLSYNQLSYAGTLGLRVRAGGET